MLHVCSIFVWIVIKMQRFPLILNGKSTDKTLFCLYEEIYFICVTYLFDMRFVLKLQFSFVFYIYIIFTFSFLADAFMQSDLQMRRIEAIKTNKRAIICKCYISILLLCYSSVSQRNVQHFAQAIIKGNISFIIFLKSHFVKSWIESNRELSESLHP